MADEKATEIIELRDREQARQGTFRTLWQSVSDMMFPQTFGIDIMRSPGQEVMSHLFDTTAMEESENMTSGLVSNLFPAGQRFFAILPTSDKESSHAKRYVSQLTEATHLAMFNSNFIAQVSNTIRYWLTFGTGNLFSEYKKGSLNYRDYSIGMYQCLEDDFGVIDTVIITTPKTARQIVKQFGEKAGVSVLRAYNNPQSREDMFNIIHVVRPREDFDPNPILRLNTRMPFESIYVQDTDQVVLEESGFDDFPFAAPRYQVMYGEVYGRGRGTTMLPEVRILNRLAKDYQEMSNKWVNPPREILESFEGTVDVTPGANNYVVTIPSIRAIEMGANGAYPVTKDILEYHREGVRQGLFKSSFEPITPLTGDRRNTTEIIERLKEGMKKMSNPLGRLFTELVAPEVTRATMLLIANGAVPPPPPELQGKPFKLEFINPLALALRDQQSRGWQYWVGVGAELEPTFPGITDNVESDVGYRELGASLGVKTDHIRPVDDRDEIRDQRQQQLEQQQQLEMATQLAEGYGKTTKAPEEGSLAEVAGAI